jgi:hypothetical protein
MWLELGVVVVMMGVTSSGGLGESRVAPDFAIGADLSRVHLTAFASPSNKIESGGGWVAGSDADVRLGRGALAGIGFHRRNGGTWTKDSLWVRAGWESRWFRVIARQDLTTLNRVSVGELTLRRDFGSLRLEETAALARYKRPDGRYDWGGYVQLGFGLHLAGRNHQ